MANENGKLSISAGTGDHPLPATEKPRRRYITSFGVVMLVVLGMAIFMLFNFRTVVVKGRSMLPTFHQNSKILVSSAYWLFGSIQDGDVVVLRDSNPDGYIIKRVVNTADEVVDWKWIPRAAPINEPYRVPAGMVYVLGENRPESEDSRVFGPKLATEILGKVLVRR